MATTQAIRDRLEAERRRILDSLESSQAQLADDDGSGTDAIRFGNHLADDGTETFEDEKAAALGLHQQTLVAEIDSALQRLDDGTYGTCTECGGDIAPERLEALPWASTCIDCKAKAESRR